MRDASQHIMFIATEYDAPGMRPYARHIINAMWQEGDHVLIVTRYGTDNDAFPGIPSNDITWIDYPKGKIHKALFRFCPVNVTRTVNEIIEQKEIRLIYSLTEELILAGSIRRLQQRIPVLYTVHDANFHDYKTKSPVRWLKNRFIIARPQRLMIERTLHQVTNSHEQQELVSERFPYHKVHYVSFPTLVSRQIAEGNTPVDELKDVPDGYILFFGTLHLYKGVHLLYNACLSHPDLCRHRLVIAGSGNIYFGRRENEDGVIFINRFIDDSEIRDLFSRAAVVVYPYTSATQSGVISIASYFGKPIVLSDLPFFSQICRGHDGVEFFPSGDDEALAQAISRALHSQANTSAIYQTEYAPQTMLKALDDAITRTLT